MTLSGEKRLQFRTNLKLRLRMLKGTPFQEFASKVFAQIHGDEFIPSIALGSLGDLKCDGMILDPLAIFACYGPAGGGTYLPEEDMRTALKKVRSDFEGALSHWPEMTAWTFVHNFVDGVPPHLIQALNEVSEGTSVKIQHFGEDAFERRILEMPEDVVEDLVGRLPTIGDYLAMQPAAVQEAVNAVAEAIFTLGYLDERTERVPADKIEINDIPAPYAHQLLTAQFGSAMVDACLARAPDATLRIRLFEAFRLKYAALRGQSLTPADILASLYVFATMGRPDCMETQTAAWSVVAFLFERCVVFESVAAETRSA